MAFIAEKALYNGLIITLINHRFPIQLSQSLVQTEVLKHSAFYSYYVATVVLYTANVTIIQKYVQMCFGGHFGFAAIQRYANAELLFVVINAIQYCKVFQIQFF